MFNKEEIKKTFPFKVVKILIIFFIFCILVVSFYYFSFPVNNLNDDLKIHVSSGDNLNSISRELKNRKIIKSEFILKSFVFLFNPDRNINRGDYLFKDNSSVFSIARQLARSEHNIDKIKITLREGLTNQEMSDILEKKIDGFNKDLFLKETYNKEGYLFPDTYFFFPMDTTEEIIFLLSQNFLNQIKKVDSLIEKNNNSLEDIIIMASIIEKEAKGEEDAYLISGILWKRLEIGMPLQVDVHRPTYEKKGLPANPICNPGILSIKASLEPVSSSYLYYLHDKNGNIYFAKDYEEHKKNINKYLR